SLTQTLSFTPPDGADFRLGFVAEGADGTVLDTDVVTVALPPAAHAAAEVPLDLDTLLDFSAAASAEAPTAARLVGSAPNPFEDAATLTVALDEATPVR